MVTDKLLILIGQDPTISHIAHKYCVCLIPNLFAYAILQPLVRYYQTQSLILPLLFSSFAALCFHIPFCWTLVFKLKLGSSAAALVSASSYLLDVLMLDAWGIHEVLFCLWENSCRILKGCLLQHEGVLSFCCSFSWNGLVIFCSVLSFKKFVVFIFGYMRQVS